MSVKNDLDTDTNVYFRVGKNTNFDQIYMMKNLSRYLKR